MSALLPVNEALQRILANIEHVDAEDVPLAEASNRVLAQDLAATRTQPPFPASAMDGYAVRFEDVETCPVTLDVIGESAAGHGFHDEIKPGQCVRIFTGAPVPPGADTIAIQENAQRDGDTVTISKGETKGRYVRPKGLDFSEGDVLLKAGDQLNPATLSLAAALNHPTLPVYRQPVVAIIATGDELVLPGQTPAVDQIIASNSFGVADIVRRAGGEVLDLGIALDTPDSLQAKFHAAEEADIVVTLGGASVGDHDLVAAGLKDKGVTLNFWKLAMRPGKPVMYGELLNRPRAQRFLGLPGNPVSSLVCAQIFLAPLIRLLTGLSPHATRLPAQLAIDLAENDQREEFMRATHVERDGGYHVTPFANQDSSILSILAEATCLMIRPAHAPAAKVGDPCEIILL
ncbi:MAG: molybdopterin molybdotransferase MoeA [Rhizobiaceae bacterium]|nr:molybdopterin molybdotransferase MoeA [Hyphomicrobiales bacterium]NRB32196.1 molybdopterin molybdotransferase MoeA [Rhizobiaceae bacterium]